MSDHGTPYRYQCGCRCGECRRANTDRIRESGAVVAHMRRKYAERSFVAGRWIAPVPEDKHGRVDTYNRLGCRCLSCTIAKREYARERRAAS